MDELITWLRGAGVTFEARGDRLAWSAPPGVMTATVLAELRAAKGEVMAALRAGEGWMPLAAAQERLYVMERLRPGSPDFNVPAAVRARGDIDEAALGCALDALLARHEALRFAFAVAADRGVQRVTQVARVPLEIREASSEREAFRAAAEEARRPFDLSAAPTVRALVLRISLSDRLVVFTFHHLTCDEMSLRLALAEIAVLYAEHARRRPARLAPPARQYRDYVADEHGAEKDWDEELAFWRRHLADLPSRPVRAAAGPAYAADVDAPCEVMTRLRDLALDERTTLFAVVFTLFALALGTELRRDDIVLGLPSNDRRGASFDGTVGTFINTIAVRAAPGSAPTLRGGLRVVRRALLEGLAHSKVPYDRVVKAVRPSSGPAELFDAWLVLRRAAPELSIEGVDLEAVDLEHAVARHELKLDLEHGPAGLRGALMGRPLAWDPSGVDRLAASVAALLACAGELADVPLAELRAVAQEHAARRVQRARESAAASARNRLKSSRRARA